MGKLKPLVIKLSGDEKYQRLLSGRPETAGFRSGLVNLKPKEEIGQHSTKEKEEVLVILNGKAEVSCDNLGLVDDVIFLTECVEARKKEFSNEIVIQDIPNFKIKVGEEFYYDINATGKNILFEDFTDLFEIDKISGMVLFTPKIEDVGLYPVWIRAYDLVGNEDLKNFEMNITK